MSKRDCEICRGSGQIRLPIYKRLRAATAFGVTHSATVAETARTYPCPECVEAVAQDRLAIIQRHALVDSRIDDPGHIDAAKRHAAHELVAGLLKHGFIRFDRGPVDEQHRAFSFHATIGVVAPTPVARLEQRIAEHQEDLAREVVAEATRQIRWWGQAYGHTAIQKEQAVGSLNDALEQVLVKRPPYRRKYD